MDRVRQPKTPEKLVPVLTAEQTRRPLAACASSTFVDLRDQELIRLFDNTAGRLAEIGNLTLDDLDLWARSGRRGAELPHLWLSAHGACRLRS